MALKFGKKGLANVLTAAEQAAISSLFEKQIGLGNIQLKGPAINIPDLNRLLGVGLNKNNTSLVQDAINRTRAFLDAQNQGDDVIGDAGGPVLTVPGPPGHHEGGGGGHGDGGFTTGGHEIPAPFTTPQSGAINRMFEDLLAGVQREPRDIEVLDPDLIQAIEDSALGLIDADAGEFISADLLGQLEGTINQLLEGQGLPADVLRALQNRNREGLATRERELLQRRTAEFGNRNAFGSGPQVRALEEIERSVTQELADAIANINLLDAQASQANRALGVQGGTALGGLLLTAEELEGQLRQAGQAGLLNLGQLNLATESTAINEALARQGLDLDALRLAISRELGLGELSLGQDTLELERQVQELLHNLTILTNFFGNRNETDNPVDVEIGDILPDFDFLDNFDFIR